MSFGATDRVVTVRGTAISLIEHATGRRPLLVLHGAGGAGAWMPYHELLAQRYDVIAPDAPGFGRSPESAHADTVEDLAFLYLDMIDELKLADPIVLGASFGGWLAAEIALLAGREISRLILVDPIGLRIPGAPVEDLFALAPAQKMQVLFHDPAAAAGLFPTQPDIDFIMGMYRDEAAFARYAWAPFCSNPKLIRRLHRIRARTLVLWGEHDRMIPRAHGDAYAAGIPAARLEVVAGAGHAVLMERPVEAVEAIERFLAEAG